MPNVTAAIGAIFVTVANVRWLGKKNVASLTKIAQPAIPRRGATQTYEASRHLIDDPGLSVGERKKVMLNLARAAIVAGTARDVPDGLVQAADLLRQLIDDRPANWTDLMGAATELVDASFLKADKHGDFSGYEEALALLGLTAEQMPPDSEAKAIVLQKRAEYQLKSAGQLPQGPQASARIWEAIASWREAIAADPPPRPERLRVMHSDIGEAISRAYPFLADPLGELEIGIGECQIALQLAGQSARKRAPVQIRLAKLLICRAVERAHGALATELASQILRQLGPAQADAAEAERLLRLAARHGEPEVRANTASFLPYVATVRAMIDGHLDAGGRKSADEWRQAAVTMEQDDPLERVRFAQGWVLFAASSQEAAACAEAYWYLMRAVPDAVAVRYLPGERERVLAGTQSKAEEAGDWLTEAGRVGDAALALELGRAVSLTEILGRDRPDLEAALDRAGDADLVRRYRAALDEYAAAAGPGQAVHGDAPQRAWSRYVQTLHEVTTAVGIDLPQAIPTMTELAQATGQGPLVYLAAASRGGYAIIVPTAGPPACLRLPELIRSEVADQVTNFLRAPDLDSAPELMALIAAAARWLWQAGLSELAEALPAGALVTIVPVGLLSLLPVHAAGGPTAPGQGPEDWEFLADRVTVRYAPNARMLARARARAASMPDDQLSLLSVAAPDAIAGSRLPHAASEAEQVWQKWHQPAGQEPVARGTLSDVEPLLAERTVWHLACHFYARPDSILDSALVLAGGELSLRAIFALPAAPRRLAILSACETHRSGTDLPDEATGLPTGLIQAGFAGVVAAHWPVSDRSTSDLMTRFHDLWRNEGLSPAAALARAQRECRAQRRYRHPFWWAPFSLTGR